MAPASVSQTAQAQAKAEAENDTTFDLVRNTQSSTTITDIILTTSDQLNVQGSSVDAGGDVNLSANGLSLDAVGSAGRTCPVYLRLRRPKPAIFRTGKRSEEHTSELQSLMRISYAVFCLKKKQQQ